MSQDDGRFMAKCVELDLVTEMDTPQQALQAILEVRSVLRKLGFRRVRARKHETWERVLEDGSVLQVRLSHKGGRDVPRP